MKPDKRSLVASIAAAICVSATHTVAAPPERLPPAPDYDVKSYPATACQLYQPTETAQFTPGSLCNDDSTDFLLVFCPIVRDDVAAEDGTYEIVVNINQAAAGPSSCAAFSYTADHEVIEVITAYAVETGKTTLHVDLNASVPGGYYDLFCGLAPGSCLYSYRVYEWEGRHDEMTDYDR